MEFSLLGQKIVTQNQAEADLAALAIAMVNQKVDEIQSARPNLGPQQVSVLALLEIAGNLVKDRELINQYREDLDQKCSLLMREIASASSLTTKPHPSQASSHDAATGPHSNSAKTERPSA